MTEETVTALQSIASALLDLSHLLQLDLLSRTTVRRSDLLQTLPMRKETLSQSLSQRPPLLDRLLKAYNSPHLSEETLRVYHFWTTVHSFISITKQKAVTAPSGPVVPSVDQVPQ